MTREQELLLQGHQIELSKLSLALSQLKEAVLAQDARKSAYERLPAWVPVKQAAVLKGGGSAQRIINSQFLQPCCGTNASKVGGRKCWPRDAVIEWLEVTDAALPAYAAKWGVKIPQGFL